MAGRPSKFTPERREKILQLVRDGNYIEVAARASGISPATLHNWKARGEEGGEPAYAEFLDAFMQAEAEAETKAVAAITGSFLKDWRSAKEYLSRRYPERWAMRDGKDEDDVASRDGFTMAELMNVEDEELVVSND